MSDTIFDRIQASTKALSIDLYASGLASFADEEKLSTESLEAVCRVLEFLQQKKNESIVNTLLKMSRLPLKEPSCVYWSARCREDTSGDGVWT